MLLSLSLIFYFFSEYSYHSFYLLLVPPGVLLLKQIYVLGYPCICWGVRKHHPWHLYLYGNHQDSCSKYRPPVESLACHNPWVECGSSATPNGTICKKEFFLVASLLLVVQCRCWVVAYRAWGYAGLPVCGVVAIWFGGRQVSGIMDMMMEKPLYGFTV